MNKANGLIIFFCSLITIGFGQKNDYIWLQGYDGYPNIIYDSIDNLYFGTSIMNFNYPALQVSIDSLQINFDRTNTSICDSNGNLLFCTNGVSVANALDETLENGDSLNAGFFEYDLAPDVQHDGYRIPQGILAIPNIANPSQYYLIYTLTDTLPGSNTSSLYTAALQTALVDMSANSGLGAVIYKNRPIIKDNIGQQVVAVRHANGYDWWLLVQKRNTNCFYKVLVDSIGFTVDSATNCLGVVNNLGSVDVGCYSPDGNKYVYLDGYTGLHIYDFDRCTGTIGNERYLPLPIIVDSFWVAMGVAISPNSQFLYVSLTDQLYQFDLTAPDIFASIDTVGIFDGFQSPFDAIFYVAQLGPDGKIYISTGDDDVYHVVNNPDEKGAACNFVQHQLLLPTVSLGVPNFPNYRLGAISICDTATGVNEVSAQKESILKVFPNPATDIVTVDYGFTNWSLNGTVSLVIVNELGQIVYSQPVPQYSGYQRIDVNRYASGIYTAYIKRNEQVIAVKEFAKE